jgi:hypothetical protein
MFTYAIRESVSVPNHFTIAYRDEESGQLIPLLNSRAVPMLFRSVAHATRYVLAYCGGTIEQEG